MKVGDLVRIKEISGTKLASKRRPVWAQIIHVNADMLASEPDRWCVCMALTDVNFSSPFRSRRRLSLQRRHFDFPTEKQVPDWVWAEIAKRALLNEGED